jgi:polar amino acid transport system substrate-binding protein
MKKYIILLSILFNFNLHAETIIIKGDEWCPFNCQSNGKTKGYMIDLAKIVFERKGHNIDYQVDSWSNSIKQVRDGKATALVAANLYDAPDFIFPENSIGISRDCFFTNKNDKWEYTTKNQLINRSIGVVESYAYSRSINEFIKEHQNNVTKAQGDKALLSLMDKLDLKKINTIIENPIVFNYYQQEKYKEMHFVEAGCAETTELYIAFSPKNPRSKEFAKILSEGIEELRKDGTLIKIIEKYSLKEWQ